MQNQANNVNWCPSNKMIDQNNDGWLCWIEAVFFLSNGAYLSSSIIPVSLKVPARS